MNISEFFPDYIEIGFVKKATGIHGKLKIAIAVEYAESFSKARNCFFILKGCMVPYFIQKRNEIAQSMVKFDSIHSPEDSKVIAGRPIYLHKDQILSSTIVVDPLQFGFLVGKAMVDVSTENVVGLVKAVEEYPEQEIAVVEMEKEKEVLIPVNEYNFHGLSEDESSAYFDIPEGLLDL